jgi:hypothetical protein
VLENVVDLDENCVQKTHDIAQRKRTSKAFGVLILSYNPSKS